MPDMLVNLLDIPPLEPELERMKNLQVTIRRALTPDKLQILEWVGRHSGPDTVGEADACFSRIPVSLFLATREKQIIGYACYNATAPDFFGPTRVMDAEQSKGIGRALLIRSLHAMRDEGYIYAIIGGVGPAEFYRVSVGAMMIEHSHPGIYRDYLGN
ncbi:MAG: GNAT family N-acetyltransferase [Sphaerochaetaceae bacterium]|jgi:GNAT superfamily N-acetyltransferase|nr:GNAT family N-acetyltransferase [Sphaerochaetaceae bacterium]NLV85114.1 GNAT family N-acetyltransferase [Spirochaetales bacterium]